MSLLIPANDNTAKPQMTHRTAFKGNNEWYTPAKYINMARDVMGSIDLDPASNAIAQETVQAGRYYTAETNGLDKDWHGKVWMNPPYSKDLMPKFAEKLIAEYDAGRVSEAIVLTNNSTDTRWFHLFFGATSGVCFPRGRIRFVSPTRGSNSPAMGQAFTYFGDNPAKFKEVFSEIGIVGVPTSRRASPRAANDNAPARAAA